MAEITLSIESPEGSRNAVLTTDPLTIGRGEAATLKINDRGLSRLHASLRRKDGRLWIQDEGSANGSFVNDRPVPPGGLPLSNGDIIRLGEATTARIQIKEPPAQAAAPEGSGKWPYLPHLIAGLAVATCLLVITGFGWQIAKKRQAERLAKEAEKLASAGRENAVTPSLTPTPFASGTVESVSPAANPVEFKPYLKMSRAEQVEFIERSARHITQLMGNREAPIDPEAATFIKPYVDGYANRVGNGQTRVWGEDLNLLFERAQKLAPYIIAAFRRENVPPVVGLYIPVIESEYRECLQSPVGAKGLFQFMGATAKYYQAYDAWERCDSIKMAPAAARYIKERIDEFGTDSMSVALGIAGYNRSPDSVRRDLQTIINSRDNERSFWTLLARKDQLDHWFQGENVKYVPKFFAAAIVGENPQYFGLKMRKLSTYDTVK